jgi:hypothetical protein
VARFSNILFVADANSWSPAAYERTLKLALRDNARLTVLDVIEELPRALAFGGINTAVELWSNAILERTERLKQLVGERPAVRSVEIHVAFGDWLDEAIHEVAQNGHDLLTIVERPPDGCRDCDSRERCYERCRSPRRRYPEQNGHGTMVSRQHGRASSAAGQLRCISD